MQVRYAGAGSPHRVKDSPTAGRRRSTLAGRAALVLAVLAVLAMGLADRTLGSAQLSNGYSGRAHLDRILGAEPGSLYVALGDSVAAPITSYVQKLFPYYQSTLGVTQLFNRARGGETSGSLRTGGQLASALADINAASDTRVVTIDIGGNDALGGCDFTSPACPFRANFSATLADLQGALANDPGTEPLIALAYYNPDVGEPGEAMRDRQLLGASVTLGCADTGAELGLNDIIAQEAAAHTVLLADAYPAFKAGGQALMSDSIHPNDAGHAAIAQAFREARAPCEAVPPTIPHLTDSVADLELPHGAERSLLAKLDGAQRNLDAGDTAGACDKLASFINQVRAQSGKKIDSADADDLIAEAEAVRESLECAG